MRPFNTRETALMQSLVPALQQAILVNKVLARQAVALEIHAELLNRSPRGGALLNRHGEVVQINRNALAILEACDGLMFEGKGIRAVLPEENIQFRKHLQTALSSSNGKISARPEICMLVTRKTAAVPLSLMFVPFHGRQPFPQDSQPQIVLFFSNLEQSADSARGVLKSLYGLTDAEAGLALLIIRGLSLEACAGRLGITLNTARTHLKKLFMKTDTNRQVELIRVMLESPATLYLE